MKTLVIENVGELEDRFQSYLRTNVENELIIHTSIYRKSQEEMFEILTTPDIEELCFESMFADKDQLFKLIGVLVKFKDKVSFRKIRVMYTKNEFDTFLSVLVNRDPEVAGKLLSDLFDIYKVYGIEYNTYEEVGDSQDFIKKSNYLKKLSYRFATVPISKKSYSDNSGHYYLYQHFPIIDVRADLRDYKYVPLAKDLCSGRMRDDFFNEVAAMLLHQKDLIEEGNLKEKDELIKDNACNLAFLNYLIAVIK